jgi:hypothetical protein
MYEKYEIFRNNAKRKNVNFFFKLIAKRLNLSGTWKIFADIFHERFRENMIKKEANTHSNLKKLAFLKKIYLASRKFSRKQKELGGLRENFRENENVGNFREKCNVWDYSRNLKFSQNLTKSTKFCEKLRGIFLSTIRCRKCLLV